MEEFAKRSAVVIVHLDMGVYLGSALGLGFWSALDSAGQCEAVTFENETAARDCVSTWVENGDPDAYGYTSVSADASATITDLCKAGLGHVLGDMLLNLDAVAAA